MPKTSLSRPLATGVVAAAITLFASAYLAGRGALLANAGPDQSGMFVGATVHLDGSASSGAITFAWTVSQKPAGSGVTLTNPASATPTFVPDKNGSYTIKLTVGDGATTASDTVVVTTANRAPIADAGSDASGPVGDTVSLSGVLSSDPDFDKITYKWTVVSRPAASVATLKKATASKTSMFLDRPGTYVVRLIVSDGQLSSAPDDVTITTSNSAPVANAGRDRRVSAASLVQLDGTGSSDLDGDLLTYHWSLKRPKGSTAVLDDPSSPLPSFIPNIAGSYTATLNVSDGVDTQKDTVVITTGATLAPVVRLGPDEVPLALGQTIQLDGSRSTSPNGGLQNYAWTIAKHPSGSVALLGGAATPRPTFTADRAGKYTFTLLMTDPGGGIANESQVFALAVPHADAGSDQSVAPGSHVSLDGSRSFHLDGTLAFGWSLIAAPAGSTAALDDPSDPQPGFVADLAGTYVAQLVVFDGTRLSDPETVTIRTVGNLPPRVDLGGDRQVTLATVVTLDANASDPNGDGLTYAWSLLSRPAGSSASLSAPSGTPVQIAPDVAGDYVVQLIATDPGGLSAVGTVVLTTGNSAAEVIAESDRTVPAGVPVVLTASASDADGDALTYDWSILTKPAGSHASISSPAAASPAFTPDVDGAYVVQVVVRDGLRVPAIDATVFRVGGFGDPPVADAGDDQTVDVGTSVQLDGSASADPEGHALSYAWSFTSKPAGSAAVLSSATSVAPTFTADVAGVYVLSLVVNDGGSGSAPDTVTISTRRSLSILPSGVSIAPSGSTTVTISISYATATPVVAQLSSSNTTIAAVPASVTIPALATSATFNITAGSTSGGAMVTAASTGIGPGKCAVAVGGRLAQWNVDASGAWETASNWTDNLVPAAGDVVVIDRPAGNFVVTIGASTAAVASLLAKESLNVFSTLTVNGEAAFSGGVNLSGTLTGTGNATLGSPMTWTSGLIQLAGGLEVLAGRTVSFPGNGQTRVLINSSLVNHGTIDMPTGTALMGQGTVAVTNAADGLWTVGDSTLTTNGGGALTFVNAGTLRKTAGTGTFTLAGLFAYSNTGTLDIQSGVLQVTSPSGLVNSGQVALAAGTNFWTDLVTFAAGTTFSGSGTLSMNGTTTVPTNLTITLPTILSTTLTGSGTVHMNAPMTWTSGLIQLAGGLEVLAGRTVSFPGNGQTRVLINSSLVNHGTIDMPTGTALMGQGTVAVTNAADGLWTVGDSTLTTNGGGALTFVNAGTLRKTAGTGTFTLAGLFAYSNTGTLDIQSGVLQVTSPSGLVNSGQVALAAGTNFWTDLVTFAAGTTFSGSGTLSMNGTTTVPTNLTITLPTILSTTLTGSGTVHMNAPMTWTSGLIQLAGGLEVLAGRTVSFPGNGQTRVLINSSLVNHGTIDMPTGTALMGQGTVAVTNAADGLWTVGDSTLTTNGGGALTFVNAGTLRKTAGTGTFTLAGLFAYSNTGTLDIQSGVLQVTSPSGLVNSGQVALAAGTNFWTDLVTFAAGTTFSGSGTLSMNGTTTVTTNLTITLPTILSTTLTGSGTVHMNRPMTWTSGLIQLAGGLEVLAGRTVSFPGNGQTRVLINSSLVNHGTIDMPTGTALMGQGTVAVTNAADGLWTVGDSTLTTNGGGALTFVNAGTLRKTAGTGTFTLAGLFAYSNTGTLDIQSGVLQVTSPSGLVNSGQVALAAGTNFWTDLVTFAAGSTFSGTGTLSMNGTTTVTGDVTIAVPVILASTLTGSGTVHMGAAMAWQSGTLQLAGGLEMLAGHTLTLGGSGQTLVMLTGTSLRNFGTVSWNPTSPLMYQGGNITIDNKAGAQWNLSAGTYTLTSNSGPTPAGSFAFVNHGTMQGTGSPTLNVASTVSFSNPGTISGITVVFVP